MIKSINVWSFEPGLTLREMMLKAKALGFEGFEPGIAETGEFSLESTDDEVRAVRQMADEIGIELVSLASGLSWGCNPVSNCEDVRKKSIQQVKRVMQCAKLIGVDAVLYVPGMVGTGFWGGQDDLVSYKDAWSRAIENCRVLGAYGEELGVTLAVENVWNNFLLSPIEFKAFLDEVNSPCVAAYFDVGNVVKFGFPEMWIEILGKQISRIHIKDFRRSIGTLEGFTDLLSGDVDYVKVMQALKAAGYDGPITGEINTDVACYVENRVARASRAMDVILQRS